MQSDEDFERILTLELASDHDHESNSLQPLRIQGGELISNSNFIEQMQPYCI